MERNKLNTIFKNKIFIHIINILLIFIILSFSYFKIGFLNYEPPAHDTINWRNSANSLLEYNKTHSDQALWQPNVFSGMPSYMISFSSKWPFINNLRRLFEYFMDWRLIVLFCSAIGVYGLIIYLGFSPFIALFGAISFVFSTHFIGLMEIGHNPKFRAILIIPWIFWGVVYLREKRNLLGLGATAMFLVAQLRDNHPQISYYTLMFIGLYWIFELYFAFKDKKLKDFSMFTILLIGVFILSFLAISQPYLSTYEYGHYTIRGGDSGLSKDYATSWSFHPSEIVTFIIPGFFGGIMQNYWGWMPFTQTIMYMGILVFFFAILGIALSKSRFVKFLITASIFTLLISFGRHLSIVSNFMLSYFPLFNKFRVPTMILVLLQFAIVIFASFGLKEMFDKIMSDDENFRIFFMKIIKVFVISILIFFILLGMVSSLEITKEMLMSKSATSMNFFVFMMIISALFGFAYILIYPLLQKKNLSLKDNIIRYIILGFVIFSVFYIGWGVMKTKPFIHNNDFRYYQNVNQFKMVISERIAILKHDAMISFSILLLTLFTIFGVIKKKINPKFLMILILVLGTTDLLIQRGNFLQNLQKDDKIISQNFQKSNIDKWLEKDDEIFRIYPLGQDFGTNKYAAYNQTIGGYHGAKLKRYQMILEKCLNTELQIGIPINWNIVNMLNVKYILFKESLRLPGLQFKTYDKAEKTAVMYNENYLKRAWFVDNVEFFKDEEDIFKRLNQKTFDPAKTAIVEEDISGIDSPDSTEVRLTNFDLHQVDFEVFTDKNAFLTVSEIYYPAGWKAFVDDKEVKIYPTNYILRGIIVPAGKHKVSFKFSPKIYNVSVKLSLIGNILIILITLLGGFLYYKSDFSGKTEYYIANNKIEE